MFKKALIISFLSFLLIAPRLSSATEKKVEIDLFYSPTCSHCENLIRELNTLKEKYPSIEISQFNVYTDQASQDTFNQLGKIYGQVIQSVPTVLINDKALIGDSSSTLSSLENEIIYCQTNSCINPSEKIAAYQEENSASSANPNQQKIIYLLIGLGIVIVFATIIIFFFKGKNKHDRSNSQPASSGNN